MIYTRSPYYEYIDATGVPEEFNLGRFRIWVWKGTPDDKPVLYSYEAGSYLYNRKRSIVFFLLTAYP